MTCVVGLLDKGDVWMGADSQSSDDDDFSIECKIPKIFRKGPFVIGTSGSKRARQLIHYAMQMPDHPGRMSGEEYMSTLFVDALRACLTDGGYAEKVDDAERFGSEYLVGYRGNIFTVCSDYQVSIPTDGFTATGSGRDFAHASLFTTKGINIPPKKRVLLALKSAARYSCCVGGRFHIVGPRSRKEGVQ